MVYLFYLPTDESDESFAISTVDNLVSYRILSKKDIKNTMGDNFEEGNYTINYSGNHSIKENSFNSFGESLKNFWSMMLGDYDSLNPWEDRKSSFIIKFAYSVFLNILILNILSMYLKNFFFIFSSFFSNIVFLESCNRK